MREEPGERAKLAHWFKDDDLRSVRESPPDAGWKALWRDARERLDELGR